MTRPGDQTPGSSAEQDPTGIRDLLASLPDPGPMPDLLSRRIADSLSREAAQRGGSATPGHRTDQAPPPPRASTPVTHQGSVVPFARPDRGDAAPGRRRRPVLPWLATAAAVASVGAATGLGAYVLSEDDGAPMAIQPGGTEREDAAEAPPVAQPNPFTDIKVWDTGTAYDSGALQEQAGEFLSASTDLNFEEVPVGDAWECVVGLPDVDAAQVDQVRADAITLDGEPAQLLVVTTTDDRVRVWAVAPDCSGSTEVLEGPVTPLP